MEIKVIENKPNGKGSIKSVLDWITDKDQKASDASGLWDRLIPELRQSVRYEFSEANPNKWNPLSESWLEEKKDNGWPSTIGIATGALKIAATEGARIHATKDHLSWGINEDMVGHKGLPVGEYASDFNAVRPIFGYTVAFIRRIYKSAVKKWIGEENE